MRVLVERVGAAKAGVCVVGAVSCMLWYARYDTKLMCVCVLLCCCVCVAEEEEEEAQQQVASSLVCLCLCWMDGWCLYFCAGCFLEHSRVFGFLYLCNFGIHLLNCIESHLNVLIFHFTI